MKTNVVNGHAEPCEGPIEKIADLSSMEAKVVNKPGNVVDEQDTIFRLVADGDIEKSVGKKVDGEGQIWNDDGKIICRANCSRLVVRNL